ncbi:PAS domain-containing protein [Cyclobacterium qasimii]|uniref:PAS domain-containing protein n=1 Tax=Cyclobacterium qasimii TaxID=1350429 RepID=UPI0013771EA6
MFFNLSPELLCLVGFDGCFVKINPAFQKVLGYSEQELVNKPLNDFIHINDKESTHQIRENLKKALR